MKSLGKFVILIAVFQHVLFVCTSADEATPTTLLATPSTGTEDGPSEATDVDLVSAATMGDDDSETTTVNNVENPTEKNENEASSTAITANEENLYSDGTMTSTVEAPPTTASSMSVPIPSSSSSSSTSTSSTTPTAGIFSPDMTEAALNKTLNDLSTVYEVLTTYQGLFTDITPTPTQGVFMSRSLMTPTEGATPAGQSGLRLTTKSVAGEQYNHLRNLIILVGVALFISQLLILACIIVYVRKSVNESRSWDPPPVRYGSVSSQYQADIDMTEKGQHNLALEVSDEVQNTDEMKEKNCPNQRCSRNRNSVAVPITITNEQGWCVPYTTAEEGTTTMPLQSINQKPTTSIEEDNINNRQSCSS